MKKQLAIYLAMCAMALACVSCLGDDDEDSVIVYPYASLLSFSVGNMELPVSTVTDEGKDTTIIKLVAGSAYRFVIDDKNMQVYNRDSLPKGCNVSKVITYVSCDGIPYFYQPESDTFEPLSSSDSIDFTSPRRLLIASTDGTYMREYTVTLNVHSVDPEEMSWSSLATPAVDKPVRAIPFKDKLLLYGCNAAGEAVVAASTLSGDPSWDAPAAILAGLDEKALNTVTLFNETLYMAQADGKLAQSADGYVWEYATGTTAYSANAAGFNLKTLLAASQQDGKMWAVASIDGAAADSIVYTTDGINFVTTTAVEQDFPCHKVSSAVYPLSTNADITRYVLVGYATSQANAAPVVWSKLSTEDYWMQLVSDGDKKYKCPVLENLTVLHYDGMLYAFGGAGVVADEEIKPFAALYMSRDNGLTWLQADDKYIKLPEALAGSDAPYTAVVDNNHRIWIIAGGDTPQVWRGSINRLQFQ